jgi:hypothetical protein
VSKTPSPPEEIVDPYPDPDPVTAQPAEDGAELTWPGWNGRSSKISLAYPVNRDFVIVGPGSECIDCLKHDPPRRDRSHQFHVRASKVGDVWTGPESVHVMGLRDLGALRNTPEAHDRALRQSEVDEARGVFGTRDNPAGLPSLRERSLDQVKREWHPVLRDGPAGAMAIETGQRRDEVAQLRDAVKAGMAEGAAPLVEAIKQALAGRSPKPTAEEAES